ncbi:MAG: acyl-CoA dehydratase activase [Clostridiales Family XIII bacterium]|jgi:predicted CoA-substrate-specific enzyme activase|nr:acyl-CoA dehydratase activase [Clostridiales Family XIII bacterium]
MERYYLGIDIGSSSSKAVVIDAQATVRGCHIINLGTGSRGPAVAIESALQMAGIGEDSVAARVATGYGRMIFMGADRQVTEISCHARGVKHRIPSAQTVIDIGGQDAKVIRIKPDGRVENFVMNDKCAAGTGRFLEVMARVLDVGIDELSALAEKGRPGVNISSTCTVFAESEVISQLSAGSRIEDVALGAHRSIAEKIAGLAGRVGIAEDVVMTGGVALNGSVLSAVEDAIGLPVTRMDEPQAAGAFGAALYARDADTLTGQDTPGNR